MDGPKTPASFLQDSFAEQNAYVSDAMPWLMAIYVNYISLYLELGLLLWIGVKYFVRRKANTSARRYRWCCQALSRASHADREKEPSKFRLPTRFVATMILSIILVTAAAWRFGNFWSGLAVTFGKIETEYESMKAPLAQNAQADISSAWKSLASLPSVVEELKTLAGVDAGLLEDMIGVLLGIVQKLLDSTGTIPITIAAKKVEFVMSHTIHALHVACRVGVAATVIAYLALVVVMAVFVHNVWTLGRFQSATVQRLFHPKHGYAPSLNAAAESDETRARNSQLQQDSGDEGNGEDNETKNNDEGTHNEEQPGDPTDLRQGASIAKQAPRFTLLDLCKLQGRGPTRAEMYLMEAEDSDEQRRKLVNHTTQSLQYRRSLSSVSFLGTYIYTQVLSFILYFWVVFCAILFPVQPLFWLAVWEFRDFFLGLAFLVLVKNIIRWSLKRRLEMDKRHYCGMKHPRQSGYFDFMLTIMTCLIGWWPALTRVFVSVIASLLLVPRFDINLPGASFDSSHTKFLGLMETWRVQMEYQKVCYARSLSPNNESSDRVAGEGKTADVSAPGATASCDVELAIQEHTSNEKTAEEIGYVPPVHVGVADNNPFRQGYVLKVG